MADASKEKSTQLPDFGSVDHTIVLSDLHLADAEPPHPENPLWKRFKRPKFFIDRSFKRFLEDIQKEASGSIELVLNGDIFDFDSVMVLPEEKPFKINWLEKLRGLDSEESKSRFKMNVILNDHFVWVEAIRDFVMNGHRVIFVVGNHDMELHWPAVQEEIIEHLKLTEEKKKLVRFCSWFYISNNDTLIEHGNQYDDYCLCSNPIHPLIKVGPKVIVRLPFGNLAGKYILNGMGLMNPHVDGSFIKSSFIEYMVFFYRYIVRVQPLIMWSWFWSAFVTLAVSVREGLLPALKDPLMTESRVEEIAERANATPKMVRSLRALHVHPAIFDPLKILQELWLDRALFLGFVGLFSFWFFSTMHVFMAASWWWFVVPMAILFPVFLFYARSIESNTTKIHDSLLSRVPISAQMTNVKRVIHGHTHIEMHTRVGEVELVNTGTWSPAFVDVECTKLMGKKCFAWIRPDAEGSKNREVKLFDWRDPDFVPVDFADDPKKLIEQSLNHQRSEEVFNV